MPQHTRATVRYSVSTAFGKSFAGVAVRHALASTIGDPFATHCNRRKAAPDGRIALVFSPDPALTDHAALAAETRAPRRDNERASTCSVSNGKHVRIP